MWPLTSSTTCYSGARKTILRGGGGGEDEGDALYASASLATALHVIQVYSLDIDTSSGGGNSEPLVRWEQVDPRSSLTSEDRICVGYTCDEHHEVLALLAGLDGFIHQESNANASAAALDLETAQQLRETLYSSASAADTDTASVTTTTGAASVLSETSAPAFAHLRRSSSTETDMFSSADGLGTVADSSVQQPAQQQAADSAHHPSLPMAIQGLLVWKDPNDPASSVRGACEIDFRPLAMTLGNVPIISSSSSSPTARHTCPMVWMGSADSSRLFAYVLIKETSKLQRIPLEHEVFQFPSPIMAIDFREASSSSSPGGPERAYLAIACQDGTVRCINLSHYDETNQTWSAAEASQVIVDGPLVCLHLVPGTRKALVGSLCGYVMLQDEDGSPLLVAAGLDHQDEGTEDSVLAVHGWGAFVAIGTQTGNLLVYHKEPAGASSYKKVGDWHLPYSIHEICCIQHGRGLLVTTRKSLHWLTLIDVPQKLDPNLAKQRVQKLVELMASSKKQDNPREQPSPAVDQLPE